MRRFVSLFMVLTIVVLSLIPYSVFAYTGGLLNGKNLNGGVNGSVTAVGATIGQATDNAEGTSVTLLKHAVGNVDSVWYDLGKDYDISSYQVKATGTQNLIRYYDSQGNLISSFSPADSNGVKTNNSVSKVRKVSFLNNNTGSSVSLYEFDVFGVPSPLPAGILRGKLPTVNAGACGGGVNNAFVTDGDDATFQDMCAGAGSFLEWNVTNGGQPVNITATYFVTDGGRIDFLDLGGNVIGTMTSNASGAGYQAKIVNGVSYVRVVTVGSGTKLFELDMTIEPDVIPPANPSLLSTSSITTSSMDVKFTTPSDIDFDKYKIYRNGTLVFTSSSGTFKSTQYIYAASGLSSSTAYTWKVTSVDKSGNESTGSTVNGTTLTVDVTPPPVPLNLVASNVVSGSVKLSWSDNSNVAPDFAGWNVYKDGVKIVSSPLVTNSYVVSALSDNVTYSFIVKSIDTNGNESAASNVVLTMFDTDSPLAPIGLFVNGKSKDAGTVNFADLSWSASSESDLAGYNVYSNAVKHNGSLVTSTSYRVTPLTANVMYSFQVTAVDTASNESQKSAAVTYVMDTIAPSIPTGFSAVAHDGSVSLSWDAESSTDLAGYNLYRDGIKINSSVIITTSYNDTGLTNGVVYGYKLTSVDVLGNESAKTLNVSVIPAASALPPDVPADVVVVSRDAGLFVSWKAVVGATGYNLYVDGVKRNTSLITGTSYTVTGLTNDDTYAIKVAAVNSTGESPLSAPVDGTPSNNSLPIISYAYSLADIAAAVGSWFSSIWLILAFSIAIPLSFVVGRKVIVLFE